jgi:hypothetical protein
MMMKGIAAMPSVKLADAVILFQPFNVRTRSSLRPGAVLVAHREDRKLINRFAWSIPVVGCVCRSNDPVAQLAALMMVFRLLIVGLGADAEEVDVEFMEIEEYADAMRGY